MNKRIVLRLLGTILMVEAAAMLPALIIALSYGDGDAGSLGISALVTLACGAAMRYLPGQVKANLRAREGYVAVALAWVLLSAFGALPFCLSGFLPNYVDALFEAVSGFTTTGATVLPNFDRMPHGVVFWRSFTHWIGGMGVLVLTMALLPKLTGRSSHLIRAESPGPSLSKLAPKMGDSAKILYLIYAVLTLALFVLLIIAGMTPYDAAIHSFGTAGTGGFSNYGASVGAFRSPAVEIIITVFMFLFGVNFTLYFLIIRGRWKDALKNEEFRWYVAIVFGIAAAIILIMRPRFASLGETVRTVTFQVASVASTTGFATADFNLWPVHAKMLIFLLMFIGSCAGSTAGGMKVMRVALMAKQGRREVGRTFSPRRVKVVRFDGRGVDEGMLHQISVFGIVYVAIVLIGAVLIACEGRYDFETCLTSSLTCVSNVGPGFGAVGPSGGFCDYGPFAKLVSSVLMLAGRLELFPILALTDRDIWRKA